MQQRNRGFRCGFRGRSWRAWRTWSPVPRWGRSSRASDYARRVAIAIGLLKMLLQLQESRKTGALDVVGPAARVRFFVDEGLVVHADEGTVGETLGRILVRERVVDQEQYSAAIEWMTELRASGKKAMLGEVFVDLGLLSEQQVRAALAAQVQSKALRALAWPQARFRFMECFGGPLELKDRFVTPIEPLVIAALRLAEREDIDGLLVQALPRHAVLRTDAPGFGARIDAFRFPPAEASFVQALDGALTVKELLGAKHDDGVDRAVVLTALLLTDTLDLRATASAPAGRVSVVPRPAARSLPPNAPISSRPAPISASPVGPETPKAPMAPLLAEKAYQTGKKLVRANRLPEAVVELRRAASLYGAVEYDLWAKWAASRADEENEDRHAGPLRAVAELALAEDSERGFATFVLGHLARRRGEEQKALALFERARSLDPEAIESGWEARLRLGSLGVTETKSDLISLAPLMSFTPVPPSITEKEETDSERGVPTLRGLATEEALASVRKREAQRVAQQEPGSGHGPADVQAPAPIQAPADESPPESAPAPESAPPPESDPKPAPELAYEPYREKSPPGTGGGWMIVVLGAVVLCGGAYLGLRSAVESPTVPREAGTVTTPAREPEPVPPPEPRSETESETERVNDASYVAVDASLPAVDAGAIANSRPAGRAERGWPAEQPATTERSEGERNVGAERGVLLMPPAADSHRVYVDGRLAGVPPPPIVVGCGKHVVKIGSQGREQSVIVPCGGSVSLAYP